MAVAIELQPFEEEDVDRLVSWIKTPDDLHGWAGLIFQFPLTREKALKYQSSASDPLQRRRIYKAVNTETGDVVGHIELSHIWPHLSGRVSRVLVGEADLRGRGLGTAMVKSLAAAAFAEFSFHRLDVGVSVDNSRAIACYRKAGFRHVGTWLNAMEAPAGNIDVYWMSLSGEEKGR